MGIESFFKSLKILVTGHTGFIGSWITKCLTMLSADVCGYALEPHTHPNMYNNLNLNRFIINVKGDIRNAELLHKTIAEFQPEIVIHLAAQPIVLESYNDPVDTFDINVTGTVNLLNEMRKVGSVKVIIVMTSDKSYRNNEWAYPYRENDVLGGKDPYSASKSCQDIVVNSFKESYFYHSGIAISSVRSGNVIGGGDWAKYRIIPDIVRSISDNETAVIRNPNSVRPWQHVLEPLSGILALAKSMWNDTTYSDSWNFGPAISKDVTVRELTEKFIKFYGKGSYRIEESKSTREATYLQLDISKAKRELKWFPKLDLDSAVRITAEWYRSYYSELEDISQKTAEQIHYYFYSGSNHDLDK